MRPCGKCIECRLERARQWAVRIMHEASMYEDNCFITLTYNNKNLPLNKSLNKHHLQLFMRYLRRHYNDKEIRFYGCGEYGNKLGRPHYHVCLFNCNFEDKELIHDPNYRWDKSHFQIGEVHKIYNSETLNKIWKKGFVSIGELTMLSAGYVARYVTKKITGVKAKNHYKGKTPEFALMSRMPGIGKKWIDKYMTDVYPKDFFTHNGIKMKPPRYYDSQLEKIKPELLEEIKNKRTSEKKFIPHKRKMAMEKYKKIVTKQLQRSMENEDRNL